MLVGKDAKHFISERLRDHINALKVEHHGVVVDAIDERAVRFYRRYDFIPFPDNPRRLFLTMATIAKALV